LPKFAVVFPDLISQKFSKFHSSFAQQYELELEEVMEQTHQEVISPAVIAQCEAAGLIQMTKADIVRELMLVLGWDTQDKYMTREQEKTEILATNFNNQSWKMYW